MERPDPSEARTPAAFARTLRALKLWGGDPSLRALARTTGIPSATLSDAMNPEKPLPQLELVRQLVPQLASDARIEQWEDAWRRCRAEALSAPVTAPSAAGLPRQLPRDVYGFVGRKDVLERLDAMVATGEMPPAAVLSALTGSGGVGKTAIAVHWAHRVAHRFPDGQLYADLAGYGPGEPRCPGEILAGFLRALGVAPSDIPASVADRTALYRSTIADKRLLVLCDNALDPDQVRPLLPSGRGALALITTRSTFTGFQARDGALRIPVDRLTRSEAFDLAEGIIGQRMAQQPAAAVNFVDLCARLPLALRVAAQHVVDRPKASIDQIVAELRRQGIGFFADDSDPHADPAALFSWSLRRLPAEAGRLFALLGLHPGRHFELPAVAALAGETVEWAERHLSMLLRASLIEECGLDRYTMHDLLLSFAASRSGELDGEMATAARDRLADYYLHSVARAKDAEFAWDTPSTDRELPGDGGNHRSFAGPVQAAGWLDEEMDNLVLLAVNWARRGSGRHVSWLSALLWRRLTLHGQYDEALSIHSAALEAATDIGDEQDIGAAEFRIGDVWWRIGEFESAETWFQAAGRHKRAAGHKAGVIHSLSGLGCVYIYTKRYEKAQRCFTECLDTAREIDDRDSQTIALHNLAEVHMKLGDWDAAVGMSRESVALADAGDQRADLVTALSALGEALARRGESAEANQVIMRAVDLAGQFDSQELLAEVWCARAVLLGLTGRRAEARGNLQRAWRIFAAAGLIAGQTEVAERLAEFSD